MSQTGTVRVIESIGSFLLEEGLRREPGTAGRRIGLLPFS
jgi:hypothetical protein